jgi:hypothetical protein
MSLGESTSAFAEKPLTTDPVRCTYYITGYFAGTSEGPASSPDCRAAAGPPRACKKSCVTVGNRVFPQSLGMTAGRNRTARFRFGTSFGMTSRLEPGDQVPHLASPLQCEIQNRVRLEPVHVSPQFLIGHPNLVEFAD